MIGWNSHARIARTSLTIVLIAGAAAAVVQFAGRTWFPSPLSEPLRASEPGEAKPIAINPSVA
jgi:hypothetical protein